MEDHDEKLVSEWSPGQAVAPCLSCQAGLCAGHGPARVATTTGVRATLGRTNRYVPECGYCRSGLTECPEHGVVRDVTTPPAPAAEAGIRARLGRTSRYVPECETCQSGVTRCPEHGLVRFASEPRPPAAEAKGEMSEEGFRLALDPFYRQAIYAGMAEAVGNREMVNEHADRAEEALKPVLAEFAALRTRAREAEGRAEREGKNRQRAEVAMRLAQAERDEAREQRDAARTQLADAKTFAYCPECDSSKVAIDTDGCCAACGTEALVTDVRAKLRDSYHALAAATARAEEAENDFKNCASVGRRLEAEMNGWRTRSAETAQAREEAEKRATLAEAHDRQPYPTAAAHEAACRTLEAERYARRKAEQDAANVRARPAALAERREGRGGEVSGGRVSKRASRRSGWWWFGHYRCGCTSEPTPRKGDVLDYCATHGMDLFQKYPERAPEAAREVAR